MLLTHFAFLLLCRSEVIWLNHIQVSLVNGLLWEISIELSRLIETAISYPCEITQVDLG